MLTSKLNISFPNISDDRGMTLMELLVAMLMGVVVTGALFGILQISLRQTILISDKVQANQLGRTAMTRIVDELHSSCLAPGFAPIQENSSTSDLRFINAYSNKAVIPTAGAFEHQIVWNPAAKTLTDYTYNSNGGEWPKFKFPEINSGHTNATPSSGVLLARNVTQTEVRNAKGEIEKLPIFEYYKYATESSSSSSKPMGTLTEITSTYLPLKAESESSTLTEKENNTEAVASVLISFRQAPVDGKSEHNQYIDLSNQATLALSAPNSETPIQDSPCE